MFVAISEDANAFGPRTDCLVVEEATTLEEALEYVKSRLPEWAIEKLQSGNIGLKVYRVASVHELRDGKLVPI